MHEPFPQLGLLSGIHTYFPIPPHLKKEGHMSDIPYIDVVLLKFIGTCFFHAEDAFFCVAGRGK